MTETRQYITVKNCPNYEITTDEPWQFRRMCDGKIVKPWSTKKNGYYRVRLDQKLRDIHKIIAEQFVDNPDNLLEVDHVDRDKTNNSLSNLRFVSRGTNQRNKSGSMKGKFEYFNEIPDGFVSFPEYILRNGDIERFETLYVRLENGELEFITGNSECQYRYVKQSEIRGRKHIRYYDSNGKNCTIYFSRIDKSQLISTTTLETTTTTQTDGTTETKTKTVINKYESAKEEPDDEMEDENIDEENM
jgi:hypothetical protein